MFSIPISAAVLAILAFLGVKLTTAQSAMVVGAVVLLVKLAVALGGYTLVTQIWARLRGKDAAVEPNAAPAASAEPGEGAS
jgi:hypothetical protein